MHHFETVITTKEKRRWGANLEQKIQLTEKYSDNFYRIKGGGNNTGCYIASNCLKS